MKIKLGDLIKLKCILKQKHASIGRKHRWSCFFNLFGSQVMKIVQIKQANQIHTRTTHQCRCFPMITCTPPTPPPRCKKKGSHILLYSFSTRLHLGSRSSEQRPKYSIRKSLYDSMINKKE